MCQGPLSSQIPKGLFVSVNTVLLAHGRGEHVTAAMSLQSWKRLSPAGSQRRPVHAMWLLSDRRPQRSPQEAARLALPQQPLPTCPGADSSQRQHQPPPNPAARLDRLGAPRPPSCPWGFPAELTRRQALALRPLYGTSEI